MQLMLLVLVLVLALHLEQLPLLQNGLAKGNNASTVGLMRILYGTVGRNTMRQLWQKRDEPWEAKSRRSPQNKDISLKNQKVKRNALLETLKMVKILLKMAKNKQMQTKKKRKRTPRRKTI